MGGIHTDRGTPNVTIFLIFLWNKIFCRIPMKVGRVMVFRKFPFPVNFAITRPNLPPHIHS